MPYCQYHPSLYNNLKHQFKGSERLPLSFSQMHQDLFVLSLLDGMQDGTYLEFGAHHPIEVNNTYLLETMYGWRGVSFELDHYFSEMFRQKRKNPIVEGDALAADYKQIIKENNLGDVIDYLSVDIEPAEGTFTVLKNLPHSEVKFRVITFEHCADCVPDGPWLREQSREFLSGLGYKLVVPDIGNEVNPGDPTNVVSVEDWWYYPGLVSDELVEILRNSTGKSISSRMTVYNLENTNLYNTMW